jgi:type VI secretion system protein ImpK
MPNYVFPAAAETALRQFRAFYDALFTVKRLLAENDLETLQNRRAGAGTREEQMVLAVRLRLRGAIAAQGCGGPIPPGAPAGVDPGYVMAAVADAVLLHDVTWAGRDGWAETPLEVVLYRSRIAGDRLFEAVEEIVKRRPGDSDDVAATILLAFELGFRGRYHDIADHGEIERLKALLFERLFHVRYEALDDHAGLLVGAAEPLIMRQPARLPRLRPWVQAIGGVMAGYLLLSWLIWRMEVGDIMANASHAARLIF